MLLRTYVLFCIFGEPEEEVKGEEEESKPKAGGSRRSRRPW
jgi:hypothetical protein